RAIEVAGHAAHRRQKKIAERMSAQPLALGEAEAKEIGDERFVVGQRDQAVANVAGRKDAEFLLQPPRRAAVIADGYDGREVAGAPLQTAQQRRQAGAAADGDDFVALLQPQTGDGRTKSLGPAAACDAADGP